MEIVFEVAAEGGSVAIERLQTKQGYKFMYHHNEMDMGDEGLEVNEKGAYTDFETPFQLINKEYPWYSLHLCYVHDDFRNYVTNELIKTLNSKGITNEDLHFSKQQLENILQIKLKFGFLPINSGMQNIEIKNLVKLVEYDYQEYTEESGF
jgi:hypothetical protein